MIVHPVPVILSSLMNLMETDDSSKKKQFFVPPWAPKPYCNNLYCTWTVEAENPDHIVSMKVVHLDMENGPDKLIIRDQETRGNQIV